MADEKNSDEGDEWDRLYEMLKVVEDPSYGWNETEQTNFM